MFFVFFSILIYKICPFENPSAYDYILLGYRAPNHKGYLGSKVLPILKKGLALKCNMIEASENVKKRNVQTNLEKIHELSLHHCIKPMVEIMKTHADKKSQAAMNRHLHMDILDNFLYICEDKRPPKSHCDFITRDLYQSLVSHDIMVQIGRGKYELINDKPYIPEFLVPLTNVSKLHLSVLKEVERLIRLNKNSEDWRLENEYSQKINIEQSVHTLRYDIALFHKDVLYWLIEADGYQHYSFPNHRDKTNGENDRAKYDKRKIYDKAKDEHALSICYVRYCMRIREDGWNNRNTDSTPSRNEYIAILKSKLTL
tara:strand:+ start:176 stop:1117 length:942 start_codon:yes stop_codon:yes gene_type:complete